MRVFVPILALAFLAGLIHAIDDSEAEAFENAEEADLAVDEDVEVAFENAEPVEADLAVDEDIQEALEDAEAVEADQAMDEQIQEALEDAVALETDFANPDNLMEALERDKRQIGCIFGDLSCKARCRNSKACCVKRYCHCTGC